MPVVPPTREQLARIAESRGLELSVDHLTAYATLLAGLTGTYDRIDRLPDPTLPVRYPRDLGYRPSPEDNPYGAWVWRCSITGAADGPLAGRRVAVKDNVAVAGLPLFHGTPAMEGFIPREDATVVTRLLDAGAEIVGKTTIPAMCLDGAAITCYPDQPRNPHDPSRAPAGSSAGSAIVVVTGEADLAVGGDQGGSVRMPASWCGCCGHKPTYGLVPYTGAFPVEPTIDHIGPLGPSVADCARMLDVIAGDDGMDPRQARVTTHPYAAGLDEGVDGLRIGLLREGFGIEGFSEPDVDAAVRAAAEALTKRGAEVEEVSVPMHVDASALWLSIGAQGAAELITNGDGCGTGWMGHYSTDMTDAFARAARTRAGDYSPTAILSLLLGRYMAQRYGHHYYARGQNLRHVLRRAYDSVLERVDVLVMPTTPMKAIPIPESHDIETVVAAALGTNAQNTSAFNLTGHPALSVPCGRSDGLPIGMMIVGRHFDDATVLRVGHAYESLRGPFPGPGGE